ncbi:MAG TPA: retroviral-like aspartic protease family protein [Thermoanaerobaculia bacterium]|nr:retroviral-like aspartic protease family protein [Thermoanaerobaculia bacterium]
MRHSLVIAVTALVAGCALYSDVSISPLLLSPGSIERGSDLPSMVRKSDYVRAVEQAATIEAKSRHNANELLFLGTAEMAAGRFDDARRHLRSALDLDPFRTTYADAAWALSQLEYLRNNFEASLEWAHVAAEHGLVVRKWHLDFLEALKNVDMYRFRGAAVERVPLRIGRPDVPRVEVTVNKTKNVIAIVDSGAVMSIVSRKFAASVPIRKLGNFEGTFEGLLGEPIQVQFGIIDSVQIGRMTIENVPVAIMPDDKMKFIVTGKNEFAIEFLLGVHLLKETRIELDFRHNQAAFTHLTSADRAAAPDQNLFWDHFRPTVRGVINRKGWYVFVLDTGSEVTFLNSAQINSLPIQLFTKVHNATLQGLGGAKKHGDEVENIEIGLDRWAGTFRTIPMYDAGSTEHEHTSGIIGENYLKNFIVTIDFGRMRLDLTPVIRIPMGEIEGLDSATGNQIPR